MKGVVDDYTSVKVDDYTSVQVDDCTSVKVDDYTSAKVDHDYALFQHSLRWQEVSTSAVLRAVARKRSSD